MPDRCDGSSGTSSSASAARSTRACHGDMTPEARPLRVVPALSMTAHAGRTRRGRDRPGGTPMRLPRVLPSRPAPGPGHQRRAPDAPDCYPTRDDARHAAACGLGCLSNSVKDAGRGLRRRAGLFGNPARPIPMIARRIPPASQSPSSRRGGGSRRGPRGATPMFPSLRTIAATALLILASGAARGPVLLGGLRRLIGWNGCGGGRRDAHGDVARGMGVFAAGAGTTTSRRAKAQRIERTRR